MIVFMISEVPPKIGWTRLTALATDRLFAHAAVTAVRLDIATQDLPACRHRPMLMRCAWHTRTCQAMAYRPLS